MSVGPYSGLQWKLVGPYIEVQWGTVEVSQTEQQITEDYSGNQRIKTVEVICMFVVLCQTNKKSTVFIHSGKHVVKVKFCEVYSRTYNLLCRVVACSSHNCKLIQICSQVVFTKIQYKGGLEIHLILKKSLCIIYSFICYLYFYEFFISIFWHVYMIIYENIYVNCDVPMKRRVYASPSQIHHCSKLKHVQDGIPRNIPTPLNCTQVFLCQKWKYKQKRNCYNVIKIFSL